MVHAEGHERGLQEERTGRIGDAHGVSPVGLVGPEGGGRIEQASRTGHRRCVGIVPVQQHPGGDLVERSRIGGVAVPEVDVGPVGQGHRHQGHGQSERLLQAPQCPGTRPHHHRPGQRHQHQ